MAVASATTANAIKAYLEALNLGVSVYRDDPAQDAKLPYVTVSEGISNVPDKLEDGGPSTTTEKAQVDVWMQWKGKTRALTESWTLPGTVERALHGARLATAPTRVYAVLVRNAIRMLERDENVVHVAITVDIRREL